MEFIIHRINKIKDLKLLPKNFGAEVDIRSNGSKIILNHEPFKKGDEFKNYLENYKHKTLVLNLKEAGFENEIIRLVKKFRIKSYFLLDVEMPYMYKATNSGQKNIAVRFSEYEPIDLVKNFKNKLKWIWIDTPTKLPIDKKNLKIISYFKSCLVCPERWNQKKKIILYKKKLIDLNFLPNAIMTSKECLKLWGYK
tara:strand:+ start:1017 stop:1604 length:588 start_codon:yes stop_codon:yes gene_type:complete